MINCPVCGKEFEQCHTVRISGDPGDAANIFLAIHPTEGLNAYGTIWNEKQVICFHPESGHIHLRFLGNGEERLVQMVVFDGDAVWAANRYHEAHPQMCQHEGCANVGIPCYHHELDANPTAWFCEDHASLHNYCPGCGLFCDGMSPSDFTLYSGVCYDCLEAIAQENSWEDEDPGEYCCLVDEDTY